MLISTKVIQKWNSNNKKRYIQLGYTFTKMRDSFEVDVHDLPNGSNVSVDVQCDYCGKVYRKQWYHYITETANGTVNKDCCSDCKKYKIIEVSQLKYGFNSVLSIKEVQDKIKETNIQKYGCENPFGADVVKDKIYQSNLKTYGHKSPMQCHEVLERAKRTCEEKHGVPYYVMKYNGYGEHNPRWKGGVAYHRMERSTGEYVHWRKGVFSRDNYTCQCCDCRSEKGKPVILNAHHICNWKDNPNLRYELTNGITLCVDCHSLFHQEYGKRNNDEMQLNEFLNRYGKKVC